MVPVAVIGSLVSFLLIVQSLFLPKQNPLPVAVARLLQRVAVMLCHQLAPSKGGISSDQPLHRFE